MTGGRRTHRPRAQFVTGSAGVRSKSPWKPSPRRRRESLGDYEKRLDQEYRAHYFRSEARKVVRRGKSSSKAYQRRLDQKIEELEQQSLSFADQSISKRLKEKRITRSDGFRSQKVIDTTSDGKSERSDGDSQQPPQRTVFVNPEWESSAEWTQVLVLSDQLFEFMNRQSTLREFENANQPGTSSALVQEVVLPVLMDMGFTSEAKGLFADYPTKGLRPDYFKAVGNSGVIVEVERGKTTTNNMDLLDFWKCHICQHANYLFLLVPLALRHNETVKTPKPEYETVRNRLSAFFRAGNYTNVKGLVLFGY